MQVDIVETKENLESLQGVVVVLDIYRASNTIISLLTAGAAEIVLLSDLQAAYALKKQNPDWLLFGEREGLPPEGFDGGNSPSAASRLPLKGRNVIFTTSAGTQAVHRLRGAQAVFFGSFANARALTRAIGSLAPEEVHFLPMGFRAQEPATEDSQAALYLRGCLQKTPPNFGEIKKLLLNCAGADRLRRLGQEEDLALCTTLDSHQMVPVVDYQKFPLARAWIGRHR